MTNENETCLPLPLNVMFFFSYAIALASLSAPSPKTAATIFFFVYSNIKIDAYIEMYPVILGRLSREANNDFCACVCFRTTIGIDEERICGRKREEERKKNEKFRAIFKSVELRIAHHHFNKLMRAHYFNIIHKTCMLKFEHRLKCHAHGTCLLCVSVSFSVVLGHKNNFFFP